MNVQPSVAVPACAFDPEKSITDPTCDYSELDRHIYEGYPGVCRIWKHYHEYPCPPGRHAFPRSNDHRFVTHLKCCSCRHRHCCLTFVTLTPVRTRFVFCFFEIYCGRVWLTRQQFVGQTKKVPMPLRCFKGHLNIAFASQNHSYFGRDPKFEFSWRMKKSLDPKSCHYSFAVRCEMMLKMTWLLPNQVCFMFASCFIVL